MKPNQGRTDGLISLGRISLNEDGPGTFDKKTAIEEANKHLQDENSPAFRAMTGWILAAAKPHLNDFRVEEARELPSTESLTDTQASEPEPRSEA